jgi:TRAP-type C4-dicarboxylate transport system substrate-binding protein
MVDNKSRTLRFTGRRDFLALAAGAAGASLFPFGSAHAAEFRMTAGSSHPPIIPWVGTIKDLVVPESAKRAKAAGHEIKWTEAYGGALYNFQNTLEGIENGLADIGWVGTLWETNAMPLQNVSFYAPFGSENATHIAEIGNEMTDTIPAVRDAWTKHNQIHLGSMAGDGYVLLTKQPIESVEQLKGLRIMTPGALALWLNNTGAVGIDGGLPTYYNNIQTGLADGCIPPGTGVLPFKLHEVAPYLTVVQLGASWGGALSINKRTFDKLPADLQAMFLQLGKEYTKLTLERVEANRVGQFAKLKEIGVKFPVMPREEQVKWAKTVPNIAGEWVKRNEAEGLPARQVLSAFMEGQRKRGDTPLRDWDKEL